MIRFRPHHLLCLIGWRGQGYDQAFTDNFNRIVAELKTTDAIRLVAGGDDLCAACPRSGDGDCRPEDAAAIDGRVMEKLGLATVGTYELEQLFRQVKERIKPPDLDDICRGCPWLQHGWCQDGLKLLTRSCASTMIVNNI